MRPDVGQPEVGRPPPARVRPAFGLNSSLTALLVLLALVVFNAFFTDNFLTFRTLNVNLTQVATVVIVGVGMTLAFTLPVLAAGAGGAFNGLLVTRFRIQPIIATLILYIAGRGVAQVVTNGNLQSFRNPGFEALAYGRLLGLPLQVWLMLLLALGAAWLVRVTVFGRYLEAVGDNEAAARLAGVPVNRTKLAVYTVSGLLSGVAGLVVVAINRASDANQVGLNMELDATAAVAVGGTALTGGRAHLLGTLLGACILQLIRYTLLVMLLQNRLARRVRRST